VIADGIKTPVSSTQYFILTDPEIFPDPKSFLPERWLTPVGGFNHTMANKYVVNFGRGSRACVGIKYVYILFLSSMYKSSRNALLSSNRMYFLFE